METPDKEIATPEFKETYGMLIENIPEKEPYHKRIYYPIYLFRRFIYMCVIVLFFEYPLFQIWTIILTTVPVFQSVRRRCYCTWRSSGPLKGG